MIRRERPCAKADCHPVHRQLTAAQRLVVGAVVEVDVDRTGVGVAVTVGQLAPLIVSSLPPVPSPLGSPP